MATSGPLEERIARYERIVAMRNQTPPMTYEAIGEVFGLPKQRIHAIEKAGRPRRTGRPAGPHRVERLRSKLAFWERQREVQDDPQRVAEAERRVAAISAELAREP